jgi:hypothetical protein
VSGRPLHRLVRPWRLGQRVEHGVEEVGRHRRLPGQNGLRALLGGKQTWDGDQRSEYALQKGVPVYQFIRDRMGLTSPPICPGGPPSSRSGSTATAGSGKELAVGPHVDAVQRGQRNVVILRELGSGLLAGGWQVGPARQRRAQPPSSTR